MTSSRKVIATVLLVGLMLSGDANLAVLANGASLEQAFRLPPPTFQPDITIETNAVEYTFAQQITFRLVARSKTEIVSAAVFFRARDGQLQTGKAFLEPLGTGTQATYTRDLLGGGLPPFSVLTYWWQVSDSENNLTTPPQTLDYVDNRFGWRSLSEGDVRICWHEGDQTFGQSALDVTRETLARLNVDLAAPLPPHIDIYIYSTVDELQSMLMMAGRPWQGGQARPDLGAALVAVPPGPEALLQLRRELAHELTHLLVYQAAGSGYANVPRWLDEGLAVLNEPSPNPAYQLALEASYRENKWIPLEALCAPFSSDSQVALLSYAQSQSFVQFIRDKHGNEGIRALLAAYGDGASCAGGVERALGESLASLELAWRARLGPQGAWQAVVDSIGAWVVLALLLLILPLPLMLGKVKSGK